MINEEILDIEDQRHLLNIFKIIQMYLILKRWRRRVFSYLLYRIRKTSDFFINFVQYDDISSLKTIIEYKI